MASSQISPLLLFDHHLYQNMFCYYIVTVRKVRCFTARPMCSSHQKHTHISVEDDSDNVLLHDICQSTVYVTYSYWCERWIREERTEQKEVRCATSTTQIRDAGRQRMKKHNYGGIDNVMTIDWRMSIGIHTQCITGTDDNGAKV